MSIRQASRELARAALRTRRRRLLVLGTGFVGLLVTCVLLLTLGTVGAVIVLAVLQVLTLFAVAAIYLTLGRASAQRYRASRHRLRRELRDLEQRLTSMERIASHLSDRVATVAGDHARALEELGETTKAVEAYEEALDLAPADASLREGHLRALSGCPPKGLERRYVVSIERQVAAANHEHARRLAEAGLERLPGSGRLHDLLVAALDVIGEAEAALDVAAEGARCHLAALHERRTAARTVRLEAQQRVFISGYFYSGSGAVLDHLSGLDGVVKWPRGEMRLIKFPGGLDDIGKRLAANGDLAAADLVDLYLHLTGSKVTTVPEGTYDKWRIVNKMGRSMFGRDLERSAGFLAVMLQGFLDLMARVRAGGVTVEVYEEHVRSVLQEALDAAATDVGAEHLLIDQAVTAWRLDIARFLPPSSFVVVHRDPRDQFAEVREVMRQPGRSRRMAKPEVFARSYRRNREFAAEQMKLLTKRRDHRFLPVAFEDFVVEHEQEDRRLRDFLGLQERGFTRQAFDPARSRVNVGKHAALIDAADAAALRRELPRYLNRYADPDGPLGDEERPVEGSALGWERAART